MRVAEAPAPARVRSAGSRTAIGIDAGGTKIAGLLVDETGTVLGRESAPSPSDDPGGMLDAIQGVIEVLGKEGAPVAVGVGAAGIVDFDAGVMRWAPNLAWRELALRDLVTERSGLPSVVDNDANTAAWGEHRFGAGRGRAHMLLVTVGTGIGGGIVSDGRLLRGAHGFAGEIGHVIVEPEGPECGCGNRGCWEQVASGRALDRLGAVAAREDPGSLIARLAEGEEVTGHHVSQAASRGDGIALAVFAEVGRRLGEGIAGLVNVLDPEIVVVGGGVAEVGDLLLGPAREAYAETVEAPEARQGVGIVAAELGNDAGAVGAAALALELGL